MRVVQAVVLVFALVAPGCSNDTGGTPSARTPREPDGAPPGGNPGGSESGARDPNPPVGDPFENLPPNTWTLEYVNGAKCRDGAPAGIGLNPNPQSDRLLIYLEGGGACFNSSCDVTAFDTPFIPPSDGIFDRTNPDNPVRDFNMVYIPYCTGDVFAGDAPDAVIVNGLGQPVFHQFVGYRNVGLFLSRIVPTFPNVKQVLLTGISAGGFGAGLNADRVQRAFGSVPVVLVDDSGPPMSKRAVPVCLQRQFRRVWNLDATILADCGADCPDHDDWALDVMMHTVKRSTASVTGLYSSVHDLVIRTFYGFGNDDCSAALGVVDADVYQTELMSLRQMTAPPGAIYGTYYVDGTGHTCLRGPCFSTTVTNGVSLATWLGALLAGRATHVGP
jgi:hypothetical protein